MPTLPVRVTSAAESAARDVAAIAAGTPSRALMQRAGAAAAGEIMRRYPKRLRRPVVVYAGAGNNGGDGWVVARALAAAGVAVHVVTDGSTTPDARAERALAEPFITMGDAPSARLVVDALLGTGARGAPRGWAAAQIAQLARRRGDGCAVVALDIPSGLDATTGEGEVVVPAHITLTFGTLKRGLLVARAAAGRIVLLDIGLGALDDDDGAPTLATPRWVHDQIPPIAADAHKGTRKRVVIVGGGVGMAGAAMLAARAAMRSGAGMVRLLVAPENVPVVQGAVPHALAGVWPARDADATAGIAEWADALLIGPGLGESAATRALVERLLGAWRGPVVLDADALNVFRGRTSALAALLGGRPALITPHAAEAARLAGTTTSDVLARRFDVGLELAHALGAVVLLKGVPTIVSAPGGAGAPRIVSAAGTPALATAGSGDLLSGIALTLLAQMGDPLRAGACAAWVHGRAAELATQCAAQLAAQRTAEFSTHPPAEGAAWRMASTDPTLGQVRGVTLDDVEQALASVWGESEQPLAYPVLVELPVVG